MNRSKYNLTHRNMLFIITYILIVIVGLISLFVLLSSSNMTKMYIMILCLFIVFYVYIYDYLQKQIIHLKKYIGSVLNPDVCSNLEDVTSQTPMFYAIVAGICFVIVAGIALVISSGICLKYSSQTDNPIECNLLIVLIGINLMVLSVYISMNLTNISEIHNDLNKLAKQKKFILLPNRNLFQVFWLIMAFILLVGFCIKLMTDKPIIMQLGVKSILCLFILALVFSGFISYNSNYIGSNIYNILNPNLQNEQKGFFKQ